MAPISGVVAESWYVYSMPSTAFVTGTLENAGMEGGVEFEPAPQPERRMETKRRQGKSLVLGCHMGGILG
jgi:hypothetical protein